MEVVTMKKLFVLAVALLISSAAWAADKTFTATATFAGTATFSFTLKAVSGDATADNLTWTDATAFNMSSTTVAWVKADQYAEVVANITKANANVYMYTKNVADSNIADLQPNYWKDSSGTSHATYGGLVRTEGQGEAKGGEYRGYVTIYFTYSKAKNANITFDGTARFDDTNWIFDRPLADQSNEGFVLADNTIASLNGPTFGVDAKTGPYSAPGLTNNTAYMYFFGGFSNIIGGDKYSTKVYIDEEIQ